MRTQKNVVDYFPHDANASDGDTLTIIEGLFGNDGYAFWFKLLEKLARTENHYIDVNQNSKWQLFCSKAHITPEKAITIVEKLIELGALDRQLWGAGMIWSENLLSNIAPVYKNRRRELPQKPVTTDSKGISTSRNGITTSKKAITTSQSRVEYSRVKYSRVHKEINKEIKQKFGEFLNVFLTTQEYEKLLVKFGEPSTKEWIEKLSVWMKSNGKIKKDHYATILNWSRRDLENGINKGNSQTPRQLAKQYTRPEDL